MEALHDDATHSILLDFRDVSGFDVSAVNNFVRLAQRMSSGKVAFLLAAPPDLFSDLLGQICGEELTRSYRIFPDVNAALEWCEDDIIHSAHAAMTEQSDQAKRDRDELFDTVADDLLSELDRQERIESLLNTIGPYLEPQNFAPGQTLLSQGDLGPGMMFVRQGAVLERITDTSGSSSTLRTLGPGTFFSEPAAYGPWRSLHTYQAESAVQIALITPKAFLELETIAPETARTIHRLVVAALVASLGTDLRPPEWKP